jgi:tRNA 2-thiouridine synthesizing protein A
MSVDKLIDVTGKVCPLPLIAMAKEVRTMQKGEILSIIGDDPIFEESVIDFCREGAHALLDTHREGKKVTIVLQVQAKSTP